MVRYPIGRRNSRVNVGIEYTGKQAHVELAERMKQRDAGWSRSLSTSGGLS